MKCPPILPAIFLSLATAGSLLAQSAPPPSAAAAPTAPAGNDEVRGVMETFKGRGVMRDNTPPTPPKDALKTFQMRDGFTIDMMASEPESCQPLYMSWDSRGRLWLMQYLQYQFPAGLKIISYDQHLRAVYDKVPEPPPRGVKGADQVTVFEDTQGTGTYDKHTVVLSGLNMATAAIKGAGGIWVMNAPYLLFYPDANDDDIPDGDPQVVLSGFGLEDTHSLASSLHWGPDGWLYGANGSTTTGNVSSAVTKNVRFMGQHIWRYHPKTKVFEIYAEGGGNTFSCEFDAQGRVFSGTNGAARGMHYDQGMSGVKAFGKHGPPDNPYGFGYFDHMETKSDGKRFSQAFCIYDGGLMDATLGGHFVAANALQNMVYVSRRIPVTSTFRAEDDEALLHSTDRWFRPVDIKVGPDGCIYLADWYDTRLSHVSPVDDWSKTDGRVYRVRPTGANVALKPFNLHTAPVSELIEDLHHPNKWFRQQAALELGWREEKSALPQLEKLARDPKNAHALDALFAVHMLGGLDDALATDLLKHPDPYVRRWVVRCAGDRNEASTQLASALKNLAATEEQPEVRTQLLCSAKRLPAEAGLGIVRTMMERDTDLEDQRIPLLLWWAIESKAVSDRDAVLALFEDPKVWDFKLARSFGAQNLAKRWALAGGAENYESCVKLLALAKRDQDRALVIEGIASAFEGGKIPELPPALSGPLNAYFKSQMDNDLAMAVKTGNAEAVMKALAVVADKKAPTVKRVALLEALAEAGNRQVVLAIEAAITSTGDLALKKAALGEASRFDAAGINAFVADVNAGRASIAAAVASEYQTQNWVPWTEIDSISLGELQAFQLVFDSDTELTFTQILAAGSANFDDSSTPDLLARAGIGKDLEILSPQDPTFTLPSGWTGIGSDAGSASNRVPSTRSKAKAAKAKELLTTLAAAAKTLHGIGNGRMTRKGMIGSNNFILGPDLTADGHVIVANDTHLSLSNPPIFYLVHLVASGGQIPANAMGVTFPGIPGVILGNNEHIAWGATDNYIDVTDVYQETVVSCSDGTPYAGTGSPCVVFNGANVAATPRVETFKIGILGNISSTVTETFYDVAQHGPIIPTLDANYNILPLGSSAMSVKYTGYQPAQLQRGLLGVFTATTMQEAVASLDRDFTVGGENWLIGDDQGNFGWTQTCTVPRRAAGHAPWLVLPGDGTAEWGPSMDHYIPHAYNPPSGFITTANNDPIGVTANNNPFFGQPVVGGSPLYLGFDYDPGTRVGRMTKRIQAAITAGHKFTLADVASIQGDRISEWGQAIAPTFISTAADLAAEIATPGSHPNLTAIVQGADATAKGLVQTAHDLMAAWTFDTPSGLGTETTAQELSDSKAALLNAVFFSNFSHLTFDDEIAVLGVAPFDDSLRKLLVAMCNNPGSLATQVSPVTMDNILFDNLTTTTLVESKEQVAAQAIINTLDYIAQNVSPNPSSWTWGSIHTLTLDFLLPNGGLNLPVQGDMTYPNGYPRHGDDGTVDVGAHGLSLTDFTYDEGPAIRFGADLSPAGITAQNALPGGETLDPTSPHYQDQLQQWLAGTPFPLAFTTPAVLTSAQLEYTTNHDGRVVFTP